MLMTREEEIEEILMEAHSYGLRIEVMETAKKLMTENPNMDRVAAYQQAFDDWVK
jgi:hypothetical protein